MSNQVYANGMEVSCKQAAGKSICAFPDVCMTPPQTPATPPGVPIPYPNTGMASDTTDGSTSVQISGQEVLLKNKSCFKKSTGDEAGAAPMKGVMTHKNTGKVYFNAWSMDVKAEGENVVRHLDLTTHNHGSMPTNTPCWPYVDEMDVFLQIGPCGTEVTNERAACNGCAPSGPGDPCKSEDCQKARKCMLAPFDGGKAGVPNAYKCCEGQTGHHIVPVQEFSLPRTKGRKRGIPSNDALSGYNQNAAPCVCAEGEVHNEWDQEPPYGLKEHGLLGNAYITERKKKGLKTGDAAKYSDLSECGAKSVNKVFPQCTEACIKEQLDNYHEKSANVPPNDPVCRASKQGVQQDTDPHNIPTM